MSVPDRPVYKYVIMFRTITQKIRSDSRKIARYFC